MLLGFVRPLEFPAVRLREKHLTDNQVVINVWLNDLAFEVTFKLIVNITVSLYRVQSN